MFLLICPTAPTHHFTLFTDCSGFGSFQHLLSAASSGFLSASYSNDFLMQFGFNSSLPDVLERLATFVTSEQVRHQDICDDGYSAGLESETETPPPCQQHHLSPDLILSRDSGSDDDVVTLNDPICEEEFMSGRDFDYGDFALGSDDTEMGNIDSESDCAADIIQKAPDQPNANCDDIVQYTDTTTQDMLAIGPSDSGSSFNPLAYEISSDYEDGVKTGYFKRYVTNKKFILSIHYAFFFNMLV